MSIMDLFEADDEQWEVAVRRAEVIRKLVAPGGGSKVSAVTAAAKELGVSRPTIYRMISRFVPTGTAASLLPMITGRPRGSRFLDASVEGIIQREIESFFLRPVRPRLSQLIERINQRCHAAGKTAPNWRTIHARVEALDPKLKARKREETENLAQLQAVPGELRSLRPLDIVEIDHTPMDVMVVDAESRLSAGRPWLTLAIDVHSRMVLGYNLSFEAPSVVSVGLCLLNAVFDKSALMAANDLDLVWPTMGLPQKLLVDNGTEFHSRAFLRGCQDNGIEIHWRPPGAPRYGGHIERLIGTQMNAVHVLDGSTGSSVADKDGRKPEATATISMHELERWIILEIAGKYHHRLHSSLNRPPLAVWRDVAGVMPLRLPVDRLKFWVAFLPEEKRQLRRTGIHLFSIRYWSPALSQDLDRKGRLFTVRYDPRDLSRVFVRRPNGHFVEARYYNLGHPPISLWERNAAVKRLKEKGRHEIDEAMIFASIAEQRNIEDNARLKSAKARRNRERRPAKAQETNAELRLQDIDTDSPDLRPHKGSPWDET
jgi:putative transposase